MERWVKRNIAESRQQRLYSLRGVPQLDYVPYLEELAEVIGCKPSIGNVPCLIVCKALYVFDVLILNFKRTYVHQIHERKPFILI